MFKEIVHLIPKMSASDLAAMEAALGSRFVKLAKKFGKGLAASLTGGGFAGLALGLIDKLLNPLKETQDAIDKVLRQGDELVTNAKQFGTTAGKLFRLQQIAKSTGLDEGSLAILLEKFQASVAEAVQDPNKQTSVRKFVGQKDSAEAFFQFIQGLQKLNKNQQILVQQEVFGEKQILKMADFLQTDFAAQSKLVGGPTAEQLTPGLEKLGTLADLTDALEAKRTLEDTLKKSQVITQGFVESKDRQEKQNLDKENRQIQSYESLAAIAEASNEILNTGKEALLKLTGLVVQFTDLASNVKKITGSRALKGILKLGD